MERYQTVTAESKIFKDKLDEITGQINIFTSKTMHVRRDPAPEHDHDGTMSDDYYEKKADAAKIEAKKVQEKYDALQNELGQILKNLGVLGYPIEELSPR